VGHRVGAGHDGCTQHHQQSVEQVLHSEHDACRLNGLGGLIHVLDKQILSRTRAQWHQGQAKQKQLLEHGLILKFEQNLTGRHQETRSHSQPYEEFQPSFVAVFFLCLLADGDRKKHTQNHATRNGIASVQFREVLCQNQHPQLENPGVHDSPKSTIGEHAFEEIGVGEQTLYVGCELLNVETLFYFDVVVLVDGVEGYAGDCKHDSMYNCVHQETVLYLGFLLSRVSRHGSVICECRTEESGLKYLQ